MRRIAWCVVVVLAVGGSACASSTEAKKPPELDLRKIEKPPKKAEGEVVPIEERAQRIPTQEGLLDKDLETLDRLGIEPTWWFFRPEEVRGMYLFPEAKAKNAAELRLYADTLYADAVYNRKRAKATRDAMWNRIKTLRSKAERTWWQRNKGRIGAASGFVAGTLLTILITQAVN